MSMKSDLRSFAVLAWDLPVALGGIVLWFPRNLHNVVQGSHRPEPDFQVHSFSAPDQINRQLLANPAQA